MNNETTERAAIQAKEAYDYRHLTQVAQGMGFEDIAGALTELVRLRGAHQHQERSPVDRRDPPFDAIDERRSGFDRRQRSEPAKS